METEYLIHAFFATETRKKHRAFRAIPCFRGII